MYTRSCLGISRTRKRIFNGNIGKFQVRGEAMGGEGGRGDEEGEESTVFVYFSSRTEQPIDKQQRL